MLIEEGITEAQVAAVAAGADLTLRAGTAELMLLLEERGVRVTYTALLFACGGGVELEVGCILILRSMR